MISDDNSSATQKHPDVVKLREIASSLAKDAGTLVVGMQAEANTTASTKSSGTDLVTAGDEAAEKMIVERLTRLCPDDGIEGEEGASRTGTSGVVWHIDPIDGTTNYVYGLPYCVSIGATFQQDPTHQDPARRTIVAGAVFAPLANELYEAAKGYGAMCNGQPISTNPIDNLAVALLGTGFSYQPGTREEQVAKLGGIIGSVRDVRRIGAAALDLCAVASGRLDAYYEEGLKFWDMAAGILIARESGAIVTDDAGNEPTTLSLVAAAPAIHNDLLLAVQKASQ